jgi:probable HAF family extracellular repeat protein
MAGGRRVGALVALVVGLVPVVGAGCALAPPPTGGSGGGGTPAAVTVTRLIAPDGRPLFGAERINDAGQVTAQLLTRRPATTQEWFLWRGGDATRIEPVLPTFVNVADLSARGQVVGAYGSPFGEIDAFSWQAGRWTQLDDLGGQASAEAVNDRGQILGWVAPASGGGPRPVVWDGPDMITLDPVSSGLDLVDINNRGQALLTIRGQAVVWQVGGGITPLGTLGGDRSHGNDINEAGEVTGMSTTPAGEYHAFVWRDGRMTDLGTLGGDSSVGRAINEAGQVAGGATAPDGRSHPVLWGRDGRPAILGSLGGDWGSAMALNEQGQVVGDSRTASGHQHAFLWQGGRMTDLSALVSPESEFGWARDINERGQIAGMTRVPDPSAEDQPGVGVVWTAPGRLAGQPVARSRGI